MSIVIESISIQGLRKTHFDQMLAYIHWAEDRGVYYGQKDQFMRRHEDIKKWMESVVEYLDNPDFRIAK